MYVLGERPKYRERRHKRLVRLVVVIVLLGLGGGGYALWHFTAGVRAEIKHSKTDIQYHEAKNGRQVHVDETLFSVDLPTGWKAAGRTQDPYKGYIFQDAKATLTFTAYIATLPQKLAVNRVLPVRSQGGQVNFGSVEANCADSLPASTRTTAQVLTKWEGWPYYCATSSARGTIVGTISHDGIDKVTLIGAKTGKHDIFFTYSDHTNSPNFDTLYAILANFKLK